jgi:UDP-N-acetylglucosamine 2-epimerase (non-hydrolysing)
MDGSMHIVHVVGARPNFMKAAAVLRGLDGFGACQQSVVHTGQHYDPLLSDIFFEQLGLSVPDVSLEVGSGSHAEQTAAVMVAFEKAVDRLSPDWVVVYGDINSTVAAALVCAKKQIRVAHVEAGLRSRDRAMPEEINRLITDQLSDLLLTTAEDAAGNLIREGVAQDRIHFVGNVMIDTLLRMAPRAVRPESVAVEAGRYGFLTLHRPSNVDSPEVLARLLGAIDRLSGELPIVFSVHPRTALRIRDLGFEFGGNVTVVPPVGYLESLALQRDAAVVITDSGGLQEESTALGVPCLTLRENTERPITCTDGTNTLVGVDCRQLADEVRAICEGRGKRGRAPKLWDGKAGQRIAQILFAEHELRASA